MWFSLAIALCVLPALILNYQWIKRLFKRIKADFLLAKNGIIIFLEMRKVLKENRPVYNRFEYIAKKYANKAAILFEDETWTFTQIKDLADKVSIYFEQQGFKTGDTIGLLLLNCPEYNSLWLGLSRIGVKVALFNTYSGLSSLKHSINVVNCKAIIFGPTFKELIESILAELHIKGYQFNRHNESIPTDENHIDLSKSLVEIDPRQPLTNVYNIPATSTLAYVYTSGTTGLPKAAICSHFRFHLFRCVGKSIFNKPENTIIYCPMPLYHGSGIALGMGQMILLGSTIALRKKFSASNYFSDCKKYNCNVGQYIGEMLRYVLAAPENGKVNHSLDVIYGNGLKAEIWKQVVEKFDVKRIVEFYAATEGTFAMYNIDNTIGAVGYISSYLKKFIPFNLIQFSEESQEPIRDKNGYCIECKENEPGLAIGKLRHKGLSMLNFSGYTDKKETSKKILHDVFRKGDEYFNSGDILMFDENGYYYFVDRIGDTFRWKGENVSTTEIESIISNIIGLNDAIVYGVKVPGNEGRAGMAALVDPNKTLDIDNILQKFKKDMPSYAIPRFLRILKETQATSTFKNQKYNLRNEAFDINVIKDPLYFCDSSANKYVPLTNEIYDSITRGTVRI